MFAIRFIIGINPAANQRSHIVKSSLDKNFTYICNSPYICILEYLRYDMLIVLITVLLGLVI